MRLSRSFWRDRRVLITGHTGFKGSWLALWLEQMGAIVSGFSLPPESDEGAFYRLGPWDSDFHVGDIRDLGSLRRAMTEFNPSIVFHLAAEAIVRRSYQTPVATFQTNVMGTIHVLEAARTCKNIEAVLAVTSDKVYEKATEAPAREDDSLGYSDPYSSSKACVELLVRAWRSSYFENEDIAVATARAGNVIGGGDTAPDRLVPDVLRADAAGTPVILRNPHSIRPWQHVLDPLHGYLLFGQLLLDSTREGPHALNFGPEGCSWTALDVVEQLQRDLGGGHIEMSDNPGPTEASALLLDSSLARRSLGWHPVLTTETALKWTADWHSTVKSHGNLRRLALQQISEFVDRATGQLPSNL